MSEEKRREERAANDPQEEMMSMPGAADDTEGNETEIPGASAGEETDGTDSTADDAAAEAVPQGRRMSEKYARLTEAGTARYRLTGMYKEWFLD